MSLTPIIVNSLANAMDRMGIPKALKTLRDEVNAHLVSDQGEVPIPLTSFTLAAGGPLAVFASEDQPSFGLAIADAEAQCIRWNNHATPGAALCSVPIPKDLDTTEDIVLEFLCSKSGATVGDATTLTVAAFILSVGDLHDADADAGGATGALVGDAAAKTTALLTRTIVAANVPTTARKMTFTVKPTDALLGTDDLLLHECRLRYTKKPLTS